jgi:hypothetical protein
MVDFLVRLLDTMREPQRDVLGIVRIDAIEMLKPR